MRVNCLRPGSILIEINQRAGIFDDAVARQRASSLLSEQALDFEGTTRYAAEAVAYLIRAEWTTGEILVVDGGLGLGTIHA